MTDKQIIIDDVDVKDCKRRIGKDNYCRYYKRPCAENNFNCIWKKYLRKEQECEELNKEIHNLNSTIDFIKVTEHSAINKYNKLKQALTEIKQLLEDALDTDKTNAEQSFDNFYKAIELCEVLDEN